MDTWLRVTRAPEPEVVLWQNQHITKTSRFFRFILATFMTMLLLLLCLAIIATG